VNFPPTINSYPECHQVVVRAASKIVGAHRASLPQKTMVAEDFSYFLHARPGERAALRRMQCTVHQFIADLGLTANRLFLLCGSGAPRVRAAASPGGLRLRRGKPVQAWCTELCYGRLLLPPTPLFAQQQRALLISASVLVQIVRDELRKD
jgi:hypothetical protein